MTTPKKVLRELDSRDGRRSAWTGLEDESLVPHHRANRGMGGRRSGNRLSNLVWLESLVNGLIESDADWAEEARTRGIKITSHLDPSNVPIAHAVHGTVLLGDNGEVVPIDKSR